jgi:hypothetical protein
MSISVHGVVLKVINCCYVDAWSQIATTAAETRSRAGRISDFLAIGSG